MHADGSVAPEQLLNPGRIELQVDAVPDGEGGFLAATLDVTDPAEQRTRVVHGPTNNLAAYGWAPSGLVWNLGSADHPIRYLDAIPDGGYGIVLHAREDYAWHCGTSNQCLYADYDFVDHLVDGIDLQHRGVPSYGRVDSMRVDPFGGWIELNLNWQVDPSTPFATRYGPTDTSWASTLAFPGSGFTGLCGDGVGGAYFAWNVAGVTRLRRVAANGSVAPVWDPGVEIPAPIAMEADGHGGVFTAWFEADGLRAAHRDSTSGFAAGWNPSAGPIGPNAIAAKGLRLAADLRGGALAAWVDGGRGAQDLYLMRLSGGATAIPFGIRMLSSGYHDGAVHFAWTIEGAIPFDYELERMDLATGEDLVVARTRHGDGTLELDDPTVQAGHSYAYVLTGRVNGVVAYRSEPIEIAIPQGETFELALGTRTPGRRGDALRFSLPDDAPATLALHDARGRRVLAVSAAGPGWHAVNPGRLMAGVYWLRLDSAGRRVTMKMVWLD